MTERGRIGTGGSTRYALLWVIILFGAGVPTMSRAELSDDRTLDDLTLVVGQVGECVDSADCSDGVRFCSVDADCDDGVACTIDLCDADTGCVNAPVDCEVSPTPTPSGTEASDPSPTATPSDEPTPTPTPSEEPTATPTPSEEPTVTPTPAATDTPTAPVTPTDPSTPTRTHTPTWTRTATASPTATWTSAATATWTPPMPTATSTTTPTAMSTATSTTSATASATSTPQAICGNGKVEGDEECDEGRLNGFGTTCKRNCKKCTKQEIGTTAELPNDFLTKQKIIDGKKTLQDTGLAKDVTADTDKLELEPGVQRFEPQYPLWSDNSDKARWIALPECKQIDTTNKDRWKFPVGTKIWKEFKFGGKRAETRLIQKVRAKDEIASWEFIAFEWSGDGKTTSLVGNNGKENAVAADALPSTIVKVGFPVDKTFEEAKIDPPFKKEFIELAQKDGPDHTASEDKKITADKRRVDRTSKTAHADLKREGHKIPSNNDCLACHNRGGDAALGFDYLQLSTDRDAKSPNAKPKPAGGVDLATLNAHGVVTTKLTENIKVVERKDKGGVERAMVGYFHANCGHCHNPQGPRQRGAQFRFDDAKNTQSTADTSRHDAITTVVGQNNRIVAKRPLESVVFQRMLARDADNGNQMPRLATKIQDAKALELLLDWINRL